MKLIEIFFGSEPSVSLYDIVFESEEAYTYQGEKTIEKVMKNSVSTVENVKNGIHCYHFIGNESDVNECILAVIDYRINRKALVIEKANEDISRLEGMKKHYKT